MGIKPLLLSLLGVSALGGGVAGSYYYFKSDNLNSKKQTNDTTTTDSLKSTAPKPETQKNPVESGSSSAKPAQGQDSPEPRSLGQPRASQQNNEIGGSATSSAGTGGVAETGARGTIDSEGPQG